VVASAADVAATVADAFDDDAFDGALAALDNALAVNPALIVKDDLVAKGSWASRDALVAKDSWASRVKNQKQTADICRKYLPIQIWDQNLI